jgi:putative ABC transport system ATP-binding protein
MIRLGNICKSYGRGADLIRAADQVTLTVGDGEFVVITGPSGSGKTTLLNLIGGMTRPDAGDIEVAGHDLSAMTDAALSRLRARAIGFVFQFQSMMPTLSALENVLLPFAFAGKTHDEELARSLLAKVGLADRLSAYARELSAGQQRRVCIARALVAAPALLLCDEPTGDLDPDTETVIMDVLAAANKAGATVLLTTHNRELRSYGSRSLNMKMGRIMEA